ncbi:MAG: hypothetical protein ACREGG_00345, partial [Candidatus Saccharimonadales bacterium]
MQSQASTNVTMPKPFKRIRYPKRTLGAILIVIIVLVAVLLYLFVFRSSPKPYSVYHYSNLKTYTIPGAKQDGMSFLLPTELKPVGY